MFSYEKVKNEKIIFFKVGQNNLCWVLNALLAKYTKWK